MNVLAAAPVLLNETLHTTIRQHEDGWQTNHAMKALLNDYARYHLVFVVVGGAVTVGFAVLAKHLWGRYRSARRDRPTSTATERRLFFAGWLLSSFVVLSMGLLVFANTTNAINPVPGFMMASEHPTPNTTTVDAAVNTWIASGNRAVPALVEQKVRHRVSWQAPKALISALMFAVFAALTAWNAKTLIRRARMRTTQFGPHTSGLVVRQLMLVPLALLALVMFIGNTQGALAPLTISVLGGS